MSQTTSSYGQPDESYKALNVGAHRKPAPLCGAPSLTWHRAFWKNQENADDWHRNIDAFLLEVYKRCCELTTLPNAKTSYDNPASLQCHNIHKNSKTIFLFRHRSCLNNDNPKMLTRLDNSERFLRYDVFSLQIDFLGPSLTIRAELFRELWTLTCILDFDKVFPHEVSETGKEKHLAPIRFSNSKQPTGMNNTEDKPENKKYNDMIVSISEMLYNIQESIIDRFGRHKGRDIPIDLTAEEKSKLRDARSRLVNSFSTFCDHNLLEEANDSALKNQEFYAPPCNRKIAEFFGSVLGIEIKNDVARVVSTCVAGEPEKKSRLTIHSLIGNAWYKTSDAHRLIDAAWPFIHELHNVTPANLSSDRKPEFSGSLFQNRRSLYISSLGRLNPNANYDSGNTEPVIFTIFVCNRSRWQIGRIVERMHNLGVCRVVALWNLDSITDAGNQLYDLRMKLDSQTGDGLQRILPADAAKEIAAIQASVADGGLSYRVERTRYYVNQINSLLQTLRIVRIEGFQPYDQFIRRRLYGTFDFIERIGVLYADLRSEITLQLDRQRTQEFMSLGNNIKSNTDAIQDFAEQTSARTKTTNLLLDNAEFLIALPVFYYFGQILGYILKDLKTLGHLNISGDSEFFPFILSGIMTFLLLLYFRRRHNDTKAGRKKE